MLIVEDEAALARLLALELGHAGFAVSTVSTGGQALAEAHAGEFDCVILDVMLPDLSGLEVCRRVRETADIPIIMVTARGQIPDKVAGLELGADDYMVKPVNTEELAARIRAVVRRHSSEAPHRDVVYQAGNLSLWADAHRVMVDGHNVSLTPLEFRLLEYFLSRSNRVHSRDALLDAVWGVDFVGDTNLVDVTVGRLRRRLRSAGADPTIETVRGVGYVLRQEKP